MAMFLEGSLVEQLRRKAHVGEVFRVPLLSLPWVGGGEGSGGGGELSKQGSHEAVSVCQLL